MKTRHILTAIALPALLAACTQDELVEVTGQQDYNNVPTVDVTFTATKSGVDTKMATEFGWEIGDKVGLGWLNENTDGKVIFDNPLYCINTNGGSFKAETMLRVGKYIAYMPYAGLTNTDHIPFSIAKQPLITGEDRGELAKYAIFISPEITELADADDQGQVADGKQEAGLGKNVELKLSQVTNPVALNLNFSNTENLTDLKVLGVKVDVRRSSGADNSLMVGSFKYDASKTIKDIEDWSNEKVSGESFFYTAGTAPANDYTVGGIQFASEEEGVAVSNNTLKIYGYVLPLIAATSDEVMYVTVETNYGTVTIASTKDDKSPITVANAKTWIDSPIFTKFDQSATINVAIDGKNIAYADAEVATQAELEATLESIAVSGQESPVAIYLNPAQPNAGKNVVLTNFTMPESLKSVVTLYTGKNAPNGIVFEGDNNVINHQLALNAITNLNGKMVVKNCLDENKKQLATLTINSGCELVVNAGAVLTNEGAIAGNIVSTAAADASKKLAAGLYISAGENATINGLSTFNNNGEVQWIAGNIAGISNTVFAEVTDYTSFRRADNAGVTTAKFNENATLNLGSLASLKTIATIECNANVTFNINIDEFEAQTVNLSTVEAISIADGVALNIISNDEDIALSFKANAEIEVGKDAALNITNLTLATASEVTKNEGKVTFNNVGSADKMTVTGNFENVTSAE